MALDPDNTQFQRDLFVSYWKLASVYIEKKDAGLANTHYQKALDQLLWMQKKGVLAKDDEQYISQLKEILSKN